MKIADIKDRNLRMLIDSLYCKTIVLRDVKSFTKFDWSDLIKRLTREIGEIKMGLSSYERKLWNRICKEYGIPCDGDCERCCKNGK